MSDQECDVAIAGGGIAGLTAGLLSAVCGGLLAAWPAVRHGVLAPFYSRVTSGAAFMVASMPIFEPRQAAGDEKSR